MVQEVIDMALTPEEYEAALAKGDALYRASLHAVDWKQEARNRRKEAAEAKAPAGEEAAGREKGDTDPCG